MLICFATENNLTAWYKLASEVSQIFRHPADMGTDPEFISYAKSKVSKHEALTAVDYISGKNMGFIGFSRTFNRITWFGVSEEFRNKGVGTQLLKTVLRQLDHTKPITVETYPEGYELGAPAKNLYRKFGFVETESNLTGPHNLPICRMTADLSAEKRGSSFHYKYPDYDKYSKIENCLCCNDFPAPDFLVEIVELENSFAIAEKIAQGKLFGKSHVLIKKHYVNFEDILYYDMVGFMSDVQQVGRALHKVTQAVKINYEIHANSGPHIHCHLFPRYLDDDFPSAPIDYRVSEPSPYESEEEFLWFVEQMRKELCS